MSNTWLIEALPERFEVTERHRLNFDIGNNDQSQQLNAEIDAVLRVPIDGNCYLKRRSLERAVSARNEGGLARLGTLGFAAAEYSDQDPSQRGKQRGTVTAIVKEGLDESQPLHRPPDGSVVTWPLDLPSGLETNLAKLQPGAQDLVYVYKLHLPIAPPESYPVSLTAQLRIVGDDLPLALERLTDLNEKNTKMAIEVRDTISHQVRDRSVFYLVIGIKLFTLWEGDRSGVNLVRLALDWPPGGDGSDIMLGKIGDLSQLTPGRYNPATGQVEFLLSKPIRLDSDHTGIVLEMSDPTVLSSMKLKGVVEIELGGLLSGLRPFMANASGRIVAGLRAESSSELRGTVTSMFELGPGLIQRTILTADFQIDLAAKFRGRPVAQQIRFQFPGRRFRADQLRQIKTLFRDFAFPDPTDYVLSEKTESAGYLLCARRTVGGDKQYLVFHIVSEKRSVDLAVTVGTTTETRTEPLDDIAVDMAAVGPNHEGISKLMADLQPRITSILGVR